MRTVLHQRVIDANGVAGVQPWLPPMCRRGTPPAQTACCCPAHAQYQVVLPPTGTRPRLVEILLCAHHFRLSRAALVRSGAAVYDADGQYVEL